MAVNGVYERVGNMTGDIMITPLLVYKMNGWIDNWEKRKDLVALHGRNGWSKNLHAKESVCF